MNDTNPEDDGSEPVNAGDLPGSGRVNGVKGGEHIPACRADLSPGTRAITRRGILGAIGATGATLAGSGTALAQTDTPTSTQTSEPTSGDGHWLDRDYDDYVASNTEAENLVRAPSGGEFASMWLMSTPITFPAAVAGRVYSREELSALNPGDVFDAARQLVGEVYFGPFQPSGSEAAEDALVNAWYDILSAQQQYEKDLKQWVNGFRGLESQAHTAIQLETRKAFNDGAGLSTAKQRCRAAVRELYAGTENNLVMLAEEVMLRITGVFFQSAAAIQGSEEYMPDYWSYTDNANFMWSNSIQGPFQPTMHHAEYRLMDGRVLNTAVLQVMHDIDEDHSRYDSTVPSSLVAHPLMSEISNADRWAFVPSRPDKHTFDAPPVIYSPPATVNDSQYRLLAYTGDLVSKASELYNLLWDKVGSLDTEIDTFVDDTYDHFAGEETIPVTWLGADALTQSLGLDWQETKSTAYPTLFALARGYESNSSLKMDVEVLTGSQEPGDGEVFEDSLLLTMGDWVADSTTKEYDLSTDGVTVEGSKLFVPGPPFNGEHVVEFADGTSVTRNDGQIDTSGEWMQEGGEGVGFQIDLERETTLDSIESVKVHVSKALLEGKEYTVPTDEEKYPDAEVLVTTGNGFERLERGNRFILSNIIAADGTELDAMPFRDGGFVELDVSGSDEIVSRRLWTRSEQEEEQRDDDPDTDPPPGGGAPGDDPAWWMYAGGGGAAALLTYLGIKSNDGGGGR